jgi:Ca2+-binding RTX toxin-like protein
LDAPGGSGVFAEDTVNASPQIIDGNVSFADLEGNFDGGTVVVSGLLAEDRVSLRNQGTEDGQIGIDGTSVTYGNVVIGTLEGGVGGSFTVTLTSLATSAAVDALIQNLTYANVSDTPAASRTLTFKVTDSVGASTSASLPIAVTARNDAPVNTVGDAVTLDEDGSKAIEGLAVADADSTGNLTYTLSVAHGTLTVLGDVAGGVGSLNILNNGTATVTLTGTVAEINATLAAADGVTYIPTPNHHGSDALTVTVDDGGAGGKDIDIRTITIDAGNDPVDAAAPATLTASQNDAVAVPGLSISDVDAALSPDGRYEVTLSAGNGTLTLSTTDLEFVDGDGTADATMTFRGTLADINTALATAMFTPTAGYSGPATVDLAVTDGVLDDVSSGTGEATNDSASVAVTVEADPTVAAADTSVDGMEDHAVEFSSAAGNLITIGDVDSGTLTVNLTVIEGTLTLSQTGPLSVSGDGSHTVQLSGTAADINAALAGMTYRGPLNYEGGDTLTVKVSDGTNTTEQSIAITLADDGVINGTAAGEPLQGTTDDDELNGEAGADTMTGGEGNDTYIVDDMFDAVVENGGEGRDAVRASVSFTLPDNVEVLTLTGTGDTSGTGNGADNRITGNDGANTLVGGGGNDILSGGAGGDTMSGGTGNDIYAVDEEDDTVFENGGEGIDTVYASIHYELGADVEYLFLTGTGDFRGAGNALDNWIEGNSGNNLLYGGEGKDIMRGGDGDDTYIVDNDGDKAKELSASGGYDTVNASVSFVLEANVEALLLTGTGNIWGGGNAGDNLLTGNDGNNTLNGVGGADTMRGRGGDDHYVVDQAGDTVIEIANEGTDAVDSHVSYVLGDHVENLFLMGTADIDGTGNVAVNWIDGNRGANVLDGKGGDDTMRGFDGNDTYIVDDKGDKVVEMRVAGGVDTVKSSISYTLGNFVENLELTGNALSGTGNSLNNVITGNAESNLLRGNQGADVLTGGDGNDVFAYALRTDSSVAGGIDRITDFTAGDKIDLAAIDARVPSGANEAFSFVGGAAFSGKSGELRVEDKGGYWQAEADVNGDGAADFVLHVVLADGDPLTSSDFFL